MLCPKCGEEAKSKRFVTSARVFYIHEFEKGIPKGCLIDTRKSNNVVARGKRLDYRNYILPRKFKV